MAIILKIRIDAHFNATPSLKQDPQYMGLFTCKRNNELASFLCERERKESNGHSNQPI
ncbi:MAG: hypothetical protein NXY57DRAFT_970166 [Lentinula lateritia]|nr:MAG: hypothetical protein NXY57DRAFT_970166 [Lentinula lateritia]